LCPKVNFKLLFQHPHWKALDKLPESHINITKGINMPDKPLDAHPDDCPYWLAWALDNPLRRWLHNPQKILEGLVQPGQTVLDLGCGPGYFSLALARMVGANGRVVAVDLQPEMLEFVRRRAER
jgi:SAM-dependent methyltransferase